MRLRISSYHNVLQSCRQSLVYRRAPRPSPLPAFPDRTFLRAELLKFSLHSRTRFCRAFRMSAMNASQEEPPPKRKHVLVCPKRLVGRFKDLTAEEVTDLWLTAQRVGEKLEPFFDGSSLTLAIQDGPEAGQTVPHVHVHILPRKSADFKSNDEIYDEIDKGEKLLDEKLNLDEERKDRTPAVMHEEAAMLRSLF